MRPAPAHSLSAYPMKIPPNLALASSLEKKIKIIKKTRLAFTRDILGKRH